MKSLRVVAVVLGLAFCAALLLAAPALAATGEIEGRVTKEEEGEIEGASPVEVCALSVIFDGPEVCALDEGDGAYEIKNVPPGEYKVLFEPVFNPPEGSKFVPQYYREKMSFASAETVEVESGTTTESISVQLEIGGAISGKVTDLLGEPLEGVEVCAYDEAAPEFQYFCNETVANGTYEILGLPLTAYRVIFNPEEEDPYYPTRFFNEKPSLAEADRVDVTTRYEKAEDVIPNINAKLEPRVAIEGTVSEAGSGAGLEKIRVCALNSSTEAEVGCDESGRGGGYAILGLPAGSYVVAFAVPDAGGSGSGGFQRQYYEGKSSFAEAGRISALRAGVYRGIDAHLVKSPPVSSPPPAAAPPTPEQVKRPLHCRKHFRRKRVKGHLRCVRAKPKRHHHRHRHGGHGAMKGR